VLANYGTPTLNNGTLLITKRLATWTTNAASKVYGEAEPNPLTTGSGNNFVASDGITATYARATGETVNGGAPYHITATLLASAAGALDNYTITNAGGNFTITLRAATWTTNANSKHYGSADPSPITTGSGSNFISGDGVTASYARAPGEVTDAGTYHITATLTPASVLANYSITNAGGEFRIINDAPIITAVTGPSGGPVPVLSPVTVTGTFTDPGFPGDKPLYTVTSVWSNGTGGSFSPTGAVTSYDGAIGAFSITAPSNIPVGVYTVTVTVTDRFLLSSASQRQPATRFRPATLSSSSRLES